MSILYVCKGRDSKSYYRIKLEVYLVVVLSDHLSE